MGGYGRGDGGYGGASDGQRGCKSRSIKLDAYGPGLSHLCAPALDRRLDRSEAVTYMIRRGTDEALGDERRQKPVRSGAGVVSASDDLRRRGVAPLSDTGWVTRMVVRYDPHTHAQVVPPPVDLRRVAAIVRGGVGRSAE